MLRSVPLFALAAACNGDGPGEGSFTLTLEPRFLEDQGVLEEQPDIELVIGRPDGATEVLYAGRARSGTALTLPEVDPLAVGSRVGLLAEAAGGAPNRWDAAATLAYGQVTIDAELGAQNALQVLVPRAGAVFEFDRLGDARRRMGAMVAVVPGGSAYLFGGNDPDDSIGDASRQISKLAGLDSGNTQFEVLDEQLPTATVSYLNPGTYAVVDGEFSGRTMGTATPVMVDGVPMVLVAGGRTKMDAPDGVFDQWVLFDTTTDTIAGQGKLDSPHAQHLAIPFADGSVLLFGGFDGPFLPSRPSYDIWNPATRRAREGEHALDLFLGFLGAFGAPFDQDVMVCGGLNQVISGPSELTYTPERSCSLLQSNDNQATLMADLPIPLAGAAMAPLPGGQLVVSGGFTTPVIEDQQAPSWSVSSALGGVYRFDGDSWREVAELANPRCHHAMIPLADGRVLIVGGTTSGTTTYGTIEDPVKCPELYDPANDSVVELECTDVGAGAYPAWGAWPGEGATILEGYSITPAFLYVGATTYGITSLGPPLVP